MTFLLGGRTSKMARNFLSRLCWLYWTYTKDSKIENKSGSWYLLNRGRGIDQEVARARWTPEQGQQFDNESKKSAKLWGSSLFIKKAKGWDLFAPTARITLRFEYRGHNCRSCWNVIPPLIRSSTCLLMKTCHHYMPMTSNLIPWFTTRWCQVFHLGISS